MLPLGQVKNPSSAAFAVWRFGVSDPRKTRIPWGVSITLRGEAESRASEQTRGPFEGLSLKFLPFGLCI